MMKEKEFIEYCFNRHDVECNQKYSNGLPYSYHLKMVLNKAKMFLNHIQCDTEQISIILMACAGHDLIEDARVTYNDIVERAGLDVAEVIFCCTELRGRNRDERHGEEYWKLLTSNELAVFVKLCDIIANAEHSYATGSSMLNKYRNEFPKVADKLFKPKYQVMFDYLNVLLK